MQTMQKTFIKSALILTISFSTSFAEPAVVNQKEEPKLNATQLSLRNEIKLAAERGNKYLQSSQKEKGFWYDENLPAFTALALYAKMTTPGTDPQVIPEYIKNGYTFILSKAKKDGGIYGKGLATYNTSLSVMALSAANNAEYKQVLLNARHFLINLQTDWKPGIDSKKNIMNGGIGYGGSYPHSDMSNTHLALHAIRTVEQQMSETDLSNSASLDWNAAISFISSCQNLESTNTLPESGNDGSFVYFPGNSKAGTETSKTGRVTLKGYGSMSYAGLLSFIHADLDINDPRVKAVKKWLSENYTLEENPGLDQQGLFYYYHTIAKALTAANIQNLTLKDGTTVDWREQLANKILTLQKPNGAWFNENSRWLESEKDLTTAYAIITLNIIHHTY